MNNLDTGPPAYSTLDFPDCKTRQKSVCNETPGCQLYGDDCIPKVQETIASLYQGRRGDAHRTLSAVTGRNCDREFQDMYEEQFDSVDARNNRDRTIAAMFARNMSAATDWTDSSKQDIEGFFGNPGCAICTDASEMPFGRMRCCGTPVHIDCFTRWYRGKSLERQRCITCRRLPADPYQFETDAGPSLLPWRRMDANSRRHITNPRPSLPPNPVQYTDVTINATNGRCPIGQLTGGSLCTVDAELAKKIHVVVYYREGGVTSPPAQQIHDLVSQLVGPYRVDSDVDLNMDIPDDRIVEREARANKTRARIRYVFTNVFPNIQFEVGGGGLVNFASLHTVIPVPLSVFNSKLRSTHLETLHLTSDAGIQGNDGDVEEMCSILADSPLLDLRVENFNISIEAGLTVLLQQGWSRNFNHLGGVYKTQEYIRSYLRVEEENNTLLFMRIDRRPRGLGTPAGWWARYWANVQN